MEEADKEWLIATISVSWWMFLLLLAHPGCPGQNPESCKTVVCVCGSVVINIMDKLLPLLTIYLIVLSTPQLTRHWDSWCSITSSSSTTNISDANSCSALTIHVTNDSTASMKLDDGLRSRALVNSSCRLPMHVKNATNKNFITITSFMLHNSLNGAQIYSNIVTK